MRWKGETVRQFWKRVLEWHDAYAWLPVQLSDGNWTWLEKYQRRSPRIFPTCLDIRWECRLPKSEASLNREEIRKKIEYWEESLKRRSIEARNSPPPPDADD